MDNKSEESFPLLLNLPGDELRQVFVSIYSTIGEVKRKLGDLFDLDCNLNFYFGNVELRDDKRLVDYGIPELYEQTETLLRMIELGGLDLKRRPEALERTCIVVESIKKGVRDPRTLADVAKKESLRMRKESGTVQQVRTAGTPRNNVSQTDAQYSPDSYNRTTESNKTVYLETEHLQLNKKDMGKPKGNESRVRVGGTSAAVSSPKLPLEKLEESNSLGDNGDDLMTLLADSLPDLFTPKGLSSLRSGSTPRAWTTPRYTSFSLDDPSTMVSSPMGSWDTLGNENQPFLQQGSTAKDAPNWIRDYTATWNSQNNELSNCDSEQTRKQNEYQETEEEEASSKDSDQSSSESSHTKGHEDAFQGSKSGEHSTNPSTHSSSPSETNTSYYYRESRPSSSENSQLIIDHKMAKKRGRKRKHPEMTEEERKAYRAMQNRKSAERSRQRKKIQQEAYQKRMEQLCTENDELRSTVQALHERLQYLESILSVTIRPP
eukprot:jgi/Galph1/4283/GphlegSOOS_G2930.1